MICIVKFTQINGLATDLLVAAGLYPLGLPHMITSTTFASRYGSSNRCFPSNSVTNNHLCYNIIMEDGDYIRTLGIVIMCL